MQIDRDSMEKRKNEIRWCLKYFLLAIASPRHSSTAVLHFARTYLPRLLIYLFIYCNYSSWPRRHFASYPRRRIDRQIRSSLHGLHVHPREG